MNISALLIANLVRRRGGGGPRSAPCARSGSRGAARTPANVQAMFKPTFKVAPTPPMVFYVKDSPDACGRGCDTWTAAKARSIAARRLAPGNSGRRSGIASCRSIHRQDGRGDGIAGSGAPVKFEDSRAFSPARRSTAGLREHNCPADRCCARGRRQITQSRSFIPRPRGLPAWAWKIRPPTATFIAASRPPP